MTATDPLPRTRPLYRHEYEALGRQGFFDEEKVELLDGQIVLAAEEGPDHAAILRRLNRLLIEAVPAGEGEIGVGNPIGLSDLSSPEPDLMIVAPAATYRRAHPTTASLVIEVSRTSRRLDLGLKSRLYAAAGIDDYWVVDLVRAEIVVHRDPQGEAYADVTAHAQGAVQALHHPAVAVDVADLLG